MLKIGEKIRKLRSSRGISQEKLAEYLGVSFQAVSKWEREEAMPDITLIPAMASYFGVSTDELLGFNLYETERCVKEICDEAYKYRGTDDKRSEEILREGLAKYPGNDVILNNLLYTIDPEDRSGEVIDICKKLIDTTKDDEVRLDAIRILGETYFKIGDKALGRETIERLPELYFSKCELRAYLYNDEERLSEAFKEQSICFERIVRMTWILAELYERRGDKEMARAEYELGVNFLKDAGAVITPPWTRGRGDEWMEKTLSDFEKRIDVFKNSPK